MAHSALRSTIPTKGHWTYTSFFGLITKSGCFCHIYRSTLTANTSETQLSISIHKGINRETTSFMSPKGSLSTHTLVAL